MDGIILIAVIAVGFIISVAGAKKTGQIVFDKTGYNAFSGTNKLLCYLIFLLPFGIGIAGGNNPNFILVFFSCLIPIAILVINNLKAKDPKYIVGLTILQIAFGISFLMFLLLTIVIKYAFRMGSFDFGVNVNTTKGPIAQTIETAKANESARKKSNNDAAEAWAQKQGFAGADEAEEAGIKTGKEY